MSEAADATAAIMALRERIDMLDQQIIGLLQRRTLLSREAQRHRLKAGGTAVDHPREMVILNRYDELCATHGRRIAHEILTCSRGSSSEMGTTRSEGSLGLGSGSCG